MRHLIIGPFASGKSDTMLSKAAANGATIIYTTTEPSQTNLQAIARRRNIALEVIVFQCNVWLQQQPTGPLFVDDMDRLSLDNQQAIFATSSVRGIVATSRTMLDGFDTIERFSQTVRMPVEHQKIVAMMFKTFDAKFKMQPGLGVVVQPLPEMFTDQHARQAANLLHQHTDVGDTVVLGRCPQRLQYALRELNPALLFSSPKAFYGCSATNVIVLTTDMSSDQLLEALTRSRSHLTIAFVSTRPPELLALIRPEIQALIPQQSPWVNWEKFAPCDAKSFLSTCKRRKVDECDTGLTTIRPRTVTALVEKMAAKAKQLNITETQPALDLLGRELGWTTVPVATLEGNVGTSLLDALNCDFARDNGMHRIAGLAAELIVLREVCFVEPTTPNIVLPEAVYRFQRAILCDDEQFLRAWVEVPFLHTLHQTEPAWNTTFENQTKWGERAGHMARQLARSAITPHIVLPTRVDQWQAEIQWAVELYIDPARPQIPERVYWILGALSQLTEHGMQNYNLLDVICTPMLWDCTLKQELRGAESIFRIMCERARHFLCCIQTRFISPQFFVKETHGFRGAADFVINDEVVVELKCSLAGSESSAFKVVWPLQAAIYAYTLQKDTAYVFNINQNMCCKLKFNKNLFV